MVKLSPKKKAQKPKTRKPKAIPWRVKYGANYSLNLTGKF